jgi:hypothetical protein
MEVGSNNLPTILLHLAYRLITRVKLLQDAIPATHVIDAIIIGSF